MNAFLGLDLGTSAVKAVVVSGSGEVLARSRVEHAGARPGVGRADPSAWASSVARSVAALGDAAQQVTAVGFDTHCPTMVPLDAHGDSVGLGVTWDHPRMAIEFTEREGARSADVLARTGNHAAPSTTSALAHHVLTVEDPQTARRMSRLGFASTWLGALLTGELGVDPTQASYSGVFDTVSAAGDWLPEALDALELPKGLLPPVLEPLAGLGPLTADAAAKLGLTAGIPVVMGSADTPAASFALGTRPGESPFFILGTTHVINNCLDAPDSRAMALQRRGVRPKEWLINGVTNGGDALGTMAMLCGFGSVAQLVALAAKADADEIGRAPVFVGHVMPERGPIWLADPRTALVGVTRHTTRTELAHAILEGVLLTDRMVMEATVPAWIQAIRLTGAFGSDLSLPQAMADMMGRSFDIITEADLPAIGAAMMAAASQGVDVPAVLPTGTVTPGPERAELVTARRAQYRDVWQQVTGRQSVTPID